MIKRTSHQVKDQNNGQNYTKIIKNDQKINRIIME